MDPAKRDLVISESPTRPPLRNGRATLQLLIISTYFVINPVHSPRWLRFLRTVVTLIAQCSATPQAGSPVTLHCRRESICVDPTAMPPTRMMWRSPCCGRKLDSIIVGNAENPAAQPEGSARFRITQKTHRTASVQHLQVLALILPFPQHRTAKIVGQEPSDKAKPSERVGRKASGLNPLHKGTWSQGCLAGEVFCEPPCGTAPMSAGGSLRCLTLTRQSLVSSFPLFF
jgi:hypothetical protein